MPRHGVSDPAWKSGPTYGEPTSSEHAIHEEMLEETFDFDGVGRDEAEKVEGTPLIAIQEMATCNREGCDRHMKRRLVFTTANFGELQTDLLDQVDDETLAEYVHEHAERVGPESIRVGEVEISAEEIFEDPPLGPCYGRSEPDPEPRWRDI